MARSRSEEAPPLSERVVKEAIGVGMDTPMRDPILEAVEEAEGTSPPAKRAIPAASALLGIGVAVGYLLGQSDLVETEDDGEELPDLEEAVGGSDEGEAEAETEDDEPAEADGGGRRMLSKLVVFLGLVAGAALLWRRRGSEDDEWEPIEEFEPAVESVVGDEEEAEDEGGEEAESEDEDESEEEAESEDEDDSSEEEAESEDENESQ